MREKTEKNSDEKILPKKNSSAKNLTGENSASEKSLEKNSANEKMQDEKSSAKNLTNENSADEKTQVEKKSDEKNSASQKSAPPVAKNLTGEKSAGQKMQVEKNSASEKMQDEKTQDEKKSLEKNSASQKSTPSVAKNSANEKNPANENFAKNPSAKNSAGEKSASEKSANEKSADKKMQDEKSSAKNLTGEKSADEKSADEKTQVEKKSARLAPAQKSKKGFQKIRSQISKNFFSDLKKEGMIFAKIIRSPKKSGILKNIAVPPLPKNYFFVCAKNFLGKNSMETLGCETEIFCSEKILYEGQSLAILAGPQKKILEEISSEIKIEIESVPQEKEKTLFQKRVVLGGGREKNISKKFKRAAFTVKSKWTYKLNSTPEKEANGAFCFFEEGTLNIFTPTQWPRHLTKNLCDAFFLEREKIALCKTPSSAPSTNSLWGNTLLACQAAAAALVSKKPVMLQISREEQKKVFSHPGETEISCRTALTLEGKIKAASIEIKFQAGAENPFAKEITDRLAIASASIYNFENLEINASAVTSQNPPASVNIETMDAPSFFAIENHIQKICGAAGFSPEEIRFANSKILTEEKSKMPFLLDIERSADTLSAVIKQSDFRRKFAAYKLNSDLNTKKILAYDGRGIFPRGIAISCAYDASGYYGTSIFECDQKIQATLQKDGTLTIHAISPNATVLEIWKSTAAEILQIDPKNVKVNSDFKLSEEPLVPENFYSNLSIMTSLLKKCCQAIQAKRFREPLPITASKGITKAQINKWNAARFRGVPFNSTSFAAVALELQVDPCEFRVKIKNIWLALSAGKILAIKEAENRIKFSVQKTLSELLESEKIEVEKISISFVKSEEESKQLGAIVKKALPAAFCSALSQALDCHANFLPLKSDSIYSLLLQPKQKEEASSQ